MPSWNAVLQQMTEFQQQSPIDIIRRRYLKSLFKKTNRNIISYYSEWLSDPSASGTDINDMDTNAFMATIHKLDCRKGLDLILHTPGGGISATEHLVYYLKEKFGNNIRAIIPQMAMSAGTMLACSCNSIVMGKQSCLGPFDPQFNGISAERVLKEFDHAIDHIKKEPSSIPLWQVIIGKYHPTFLQQCELAKKRSKKIVKKWLTENMFLNEENAAEKAARVAQYFTDTEANEEHVRHISIKEAQACGLKILQLEDDQKLQDLVLTVHHAYMHTFSKAPTLVKAIENHMGMGMFNFSN